MFEATARSIETRTSFAMGLALGWLGKVHLALGEPGPAGALLIWSIRLKRQHGNLGGAAEALADYGLAVAAQGDPEAGLRYLLDAQDQAYRFGGGYFDAIVAIGLGKVLRQLGRPAAAAEHYHRVLRQGEPRPYERARALAGLAAALRDTDPPAARAARVGAETEFAAMGMAAAAVQAVLQD
jgi:tetratricopeptide (TPR) repeat protein